MGMVHSEKHVEVQKIITNELNMSLPQQAWVKTTVYEEERHWVSGKKK